MKKYGIWIFYNFQIQNRIVPAETIRGNTVPYFSAWDKSCDPTAKPTEES